MINSLTLVITMRLNDKKSNCQAKNLIITSSERNYKILWYNI